jgi:hypothetical protein
MDPEELRGQLHLPGAGEEATVIATRIGDRPVAILAHPA